MAQQEPQPKKVKLVDFSAASAFYGSRKGYVFKTGDQGLGYYLDDVGKAKERVLEGLEGPGLFARAPCVDVEAPETVKAPVPAPAEEPPKKKKRFDPFADLPPPKKKAAPAPKKPPTPEPEEKAPVKVFTSGLFKLEQVHCLHIVRKHKDARNPTSWRHPGRRIDRTRQDATDELEKMRTKILAAPTHRRRSLFQELAKKFSECGSAKKGGDLGMFRRCRAGVGRTFKVNDRVDGVGVDAQHAARRGKMSAAFELAAFNLDVYELSKTVASSSGVHLIYRVA